MYCLLKILGIFQTPSQSLPFHDHTLITSVQWKVTRKIITHFPTRLSNEHWQWGIVVGLGQALPIAAPLSHWSAPQWAPPPTLYKGILESGLRKDGALLFIYLVEMLICRHLSLIAFQLKSLFFAPTTCLIYWPVMRWAERAWTL